MAWPTLAIRRAVKSDHSELSVSPRRAIADTEIYVLSSKNLEILGYSFQAWILLQYCLLLAYYQWISLFTFCVPAGLPSRGGDVAAYVFNISHQACPLLCILFLCLFLPYGSFNCISFNKLSRQLSAFSLYSSGLVSASLVLSTIFSLWKSPTALI